MGGLRGVLLCVSQDPCPSPEGLWDGTDPGEGHGQHEEELEDWGHCGRCWGHACLVLGAGLLT